MAPAPASWNRQEEHPGSCVGGEVGAPKSWIPGDLRATYGASKGHLGTARFALKYLFLSCLSRRLEKTSFPWALVFLPSTPSWSLHSLFLFYLFLLFSVRNPSTFPSISSSASINSFFLVPKTSVPQILRVRGPGPWPHNHNPPTLACLLACLTLLESEMSVVDSKRRWKWRTRF